MRSWSLYQPTNVYSTPPSTLTGVAGRVSRDPLATVSTCVGSPPAKAPPLASNVTAHDMLSQPAYTTRSAAGIVAVAKSTFWACDSGLVGYSALALS